MEFTSKYGDGLGTWNGEPPLPGKKCYVEFGCAEMLRIGVNAELSTMSEPSISHDGSCMQITASVDFVFENNTAAIRIGESLILVDYEGEFPPAEAWVRISSKEFDLNEIYL